MKWLCNQCTAIRQNENALCNVLLIWDKHRDIPDAGQPVCRQPKHTDQQHQNGRPIFDVVVQFTGNPTQTEEPDNLKGAKQTADPLKEKRKRRNIR